MLIRIYRKHFKALVQPAILGADKSLLRMIQRLLLYYLQEFKSKNSTYMLSIPLDKNKTMRQLIELTVEELDPRPDPTQYRDKFTQAKQELSRFLAECLTHILGDINRLRAVIRFKTLIQDSLKKLDEVFSISFILMLDKWLSENINTEKLVANLDMLLCPFETQKSEVPTFENASEVPTFENALVNYLKSSNEIDSKSETLNELFQNLLSKKSEEILIIEKSEDKIERLFKQIIYILSNEDLVHQLKENNNLKQLIY